MQLSTENVSLTEAQKHAVDKRIKKLERLCRLFKSELVSTRLKLTIKPPINAYVAQLTLAVPGSQMASKFRDKRFSVAIGKAFDKVAAQLRKYRARLRDTRDFAKVAKDKGKA